MKCYRKFGYKYYVKQILLKKTHIWIIASFDLKLYIITKHLDNLVNIYVYSKNALHIIVIITIIIIKLTVFLDFVKS